MKGVLAATAVLGALAIGGLPVLALSLAADDTGSTATTPARLDGPPGPPAWAHGAARGRDKDKAEDEADGEGSEGRPGKGGPDGRHRGWAKQDGSAPPGWARHRPGTTPHGWAVREHAAGNGNGDRGD